MSTHTLYRGRVARQTRFRQLLARLSRALARRELSADAPRPTLDELLAPSRWQRKVGSPELKKALGYLQSSIARRAPSSCRPARFTLAPHQGDRGTIPGHARPAGQIADDRLRLGTLPDRSRRCSPARQRQLHRRPARLRSATGDGQLTLARVEPALRRGRACTDGEAITASASPAKRCTDKRPRSSPSSIRNEPRPAVTAGREQDRSAAT